MSKRQQETIVELTEALRDARLEIKELTQQRDDLIAAMSRLTEETARLYAAYEPHHY